ncbi:MAG TPA: hypothetical protein VGJ87_08855 [Roseiflexaceae bacterium]|jgi:preprotein translocase subunit YajC
MLRERIIWVVALLVVAGLGFYSGQAIGVRAGEQHQAQAAQQFFGQRGGEGGGQGAGQGAGGFRGSTGGGLAGTVSNMSGSTITIATRNGQTATVQLVADGTVHKQVDGQLSDIKQGEQIVAFGTQNGNTFQASSIQIGGGQVSSSAQSR